MITSLGLVQGYAQTKSNTWANDYNREDRANILRNRAQGRKAGSLLLCSDRLASPACETHGATAVKPNIDFPQGVTATAEIDTFHPPGKGCFYIITRWGHSRVVLQPCIG